MQNNYSASWKKRGDRTGLIRNALLKSMGYTDSDIEKPIVGIINTWAETNPPFHLNSDPLIIANAYQKVKTTAWK